MKKDNFDKSRFADIMSWYAFQVLDEAVQNSQTLPENCRVPTSKYFSGRGANLLTSVIVKYVKAIGGHAIRINSTGIMRKNKSGEMIWTKGSSKGIADIQIIYQSVPIMAEVKYKKDVQSESQKKYQNEVEKAGGKYWVISSFDSFIERL